VQVVYVPEGWYHATQTISDYSISVRYEPPDDLPGEYYYYLRRGDAKAAVQDFAGAVKLYRLGLAIQKDTVLLTHLGRALEQLALYTEAEAAYTEAVERNPRNAFHFVRLINLFVSHAAKDSSERVSELLQRAEAFQLKAEVLRLLKDVF
jgi:tetratricopeptide (TPR) repeat protein